MPSKKAKRRLRTKLMVAKNNLNLLKFEKKLKSHKNLKCISKIREFTLRGSALLGNAPT